MHGRPPKVLFDGLYFGVNTQTVLGQSPGHTWHVRRFPCKDVPVLMEELDERFFLFAVKGGGDVGRRCIGVDGVDVHGLCVPGRLKG